MMNIYRFRKCEEKLIDYVLNKRIEGSKYSTMIAGDPKEVSITADTYKVLIFYIINPYLTKLNYYYII